MAAAILHRRLDEAQVRACSTDPMRSIDFGDASPVAFWPYVESLPAEELRGHRLAAGEVSHIYRCANLRFDHILIATRTTDVYLTVVTDRLAGRVVGHRILDLRSEQVPPQAPKP